MKKLFAIFFLLVLLLFFLSGCSKNQVSKNSYTNFKFIEEVIIKDKYTYIVFYDANTGVMYMGRPVGGPSPLYNADGTLKIYTPQLSATVAN